MNKQEFIERTGLNPTNEEYQRIEAMYMAAGNIDKDVFCAQYKKHGESTLVKALFREIHLLSAKLEQRDNILDDYQEVKNELAKFLIGKAHAHEDTDLHKETVRLIGHRGVAVLTLSMGLPLWNEDIDYIKTNLT